MLLLDTHVLLWVLAGSERLGARARERLEGAGTVYASAASMWELAIKSMLGKLSLPEDILERITAQGIELLPVTPEDGLAIRRFPEIARHDPFDRLLLSQADTVGIELMTADSTLLGLGRRNILDATR